MGRKVTRLIAVLLLAAVLFSVPAYAETAVVTPAKGVNLRTGPGTEYEVIVTIPYNTEVQVTGSRGSWYEVTYGGTTGYASASYLRFVTDSSAAAGSSTASSGTSTVSIFANSAGNGTSAGTGSSSGSTVSIFQSGNTSTWYYATPTPQVQQYLGNTVTSSGTSSGASSVSSAVTSGTAGGAYTGTVTGDYVRFRSGPSVSYSIIATLRKDTPVTVLASYGDWVKCTVNGNTGFISSAYVSGNNSAATSAAGGTVSIFQNTTGSTGSTSSAGNATGNTVSIFRNASSSGTTTVTGTPAPAATPVSTPVPTASVIQIKPVTQTLGYITGNHVRFRSGPSTSYEIIGEFQYGNSVYINGLSGEWVAVTADGKSGFVSGKYVREGTWSSSDVSSKTENSGSSASEESSASGTETVAPTPVPTATPVQQTSFTAVTGQQIADLALSLVGTKYTWAGNSPEEGFDCSGLVYYVYKQFGITLARTAAEQAKNGVPVEPADLRPGDILCFSSGYNYIGHAGIYIGNGQFVHAATSKTGVIVTDLSGYYSEKGYVARRIIT